MRKRHAKRAEACEARSDGATDTLPRSHVQVRAHKTGANALSWAPAAGGMRLVTGGCDNLVKIWTYEPSADPPWVETETLPAAHTDWVRDVAWAPSVGGAAETIASCSQDKKVRDIATLRVVM